MLYATAEGTYCKPSVCMNLSVCIPDRVIKQVGLEFKLAVLCANSTRNSMMSISRKEDVSRFSRNT